MTHQHAKKELEAGTPAELICATCPWDRLCVEPPSMSEQEVKRQIDEAEQADRERDPERKGMPVGMLMTALTLGGRDTAGKQASDGIRTLMRAWGEQS